jgi:hypothetical protein
MKKIAIFISAICILCGSYSCSDMLETDSERQVFDPSLSDKTDSLFYAIGILQGLQQLADQYVYQGEMRGDLVKTTVHTDNNLRQLANFTATTANKYDSAYVYYRVINNCNYYIAHRDTTLRTGSELVVMKEYAAIKGIRAWAYMQLARTYGKVPFFTQPLTQISDIDNSQFPELKLSEIVDRLAPDLEQYTTYSTPTGGNTYPAGSVITYSKLFIPVDVILGDMYLETEQFAKAAQHYITYLTEVANDNQRHTAWIQPFSGSGRVIYMDQLPSDWDNSNFNTRGAGQWQTIFSTIGHEYITYIPMATNSQRGLTTSLPKTFGYDYYSTDLTGNSRYIDEIQIQPSESYVALSEAQPFYYKSTASTTTSTVINASNLGDQRYSGITRTSTDDESDSTTVWITKYNTARVILYRNTTVLLHLAEAFNRLGMYDAAFAILKDGISTALLAAPYLSNTTQQNLQTTYPLLSQANMSKFNTEHFMYGVHCHGTGYANDADANVYTPGMSPYQMADVIGKKMAEISAAFNVNVGTTAADSINAVEDLLCDEYALEFAFEGNRFNDLMRLARHKNAAGTYSANFGGRWLAKKLAYKNPTVALEDENNWYLPFK